MAKVPPFTELIAVTMRLAVHLETRDAYTLDDERFVRWLADGTLPVPGNPAWVGPGTPGVPQRSGGTSTTQ